MALADRQKKWEARKKRRAQERRNALLKKAIPVLAFILIAAIGIAGFNSISKASEKNTLSKHYKVITVHYGDTVWGIAEENLYGYDSVKQYIKELSFINDLEDIDSITSGDVLVVPYYQDEI